METTPPTVGGTVRRCARRSTAWACLGAILLLCGGGARAAEPKVVRLPLAEAVKAPLDPCSLDDLAKRWPAFRHEPFDTAGFNHLALPFRYEAGPQGGDANEALAFSFLLSEGLDWARGCYCTRHAYFIFKRGERYMRPLAKAYDQRAIAFAVKDWTATHAVGGLLRKKADGYGGVLEIYDADGNLLSSTPYQAPRAYFTLLGDMAVDALRFFGHPPSKALAAHLHKPRCNNFQSIQDLGAAAFAKEKTPEEFGLYDKILKRDPGFAEVRYWWACQKQWKDGDLNAYYLESARSMRDYLTPSALETFMPEKCPDRELAGRWETWLAQWERLVGEDRPELLDQRLRLRGEHVPPDRLGWATEAAAAYPNDYWLLYNLSEAYRKDWCDATMGLSLCVAALQNRYLTGEGNKDWAKAGVVTCLQELGQDAAVVAWVIPTLREDQAAGKTNDFALGSMFLGRSLARAGWYDRAVGAFQDAYEKSQEDRPWRSRMLMEGGVAAALAGREDVLAQILQDRRDELDRMQMTFLLEGYLRLIQGKPITVEEVEQQCVTKDYDFRVDKDVLCAQIDLLSKKSTHRAP